MERTESVAPPEITGDASAAVVVRGLSHTYPPGRKQTAPRQALRGIDFEIPRGEIFGFLGPNGGGKSTLCRILTTSLRPTGGTAAVMGRDAVQQPAEVRLKIGVVFQNPCLDRKLTVRENLIHQGHLYGLRGSALKSRIDAMLARVGLTDRAEEFVEGLSGGLKRRAEVAKSLLHRPEVLILDEPSTGLDPGARQDLWRYLKELKEQEHVTVLVATHLMEEAEKCDRLAILDQGKIVALGTPDELKSEIGGDVISIQTQEPQQLRSQVKAKFGVEAVVMGDTLHIEWPEGHTFIPALVEAFPKQIISVTIAKPTLEDVFIHRTNHRFWREGAE